MKKRDYYSNIFILKFIHYVSFQDAFGHIGTRPLILTKKNRREYAALAFRFGSSLFSFILILFFNQQRGACHLFRLFHSHHLNESRCDIR